MATFSAAKGYNGANVRKVLEMAIFVKPYDEADTAITKVWSTTTQLTIPTGYLPVGMTTKDDGATWSRDQESSDVNTYGQSEPVRRDITKDVSGLQFVMQESKRQTMELYHGLDLSAVATDADGNFYFDKPSRPAQPYYRVLAIGKDGDGPSAVYIARWLPRAQITENGEQAWTDGDELKYPATFTAYTDATVGTSFREIWGGPGVDHAAMGFTPPV